MTRKWARYKEIGGQEVNYSEKVIQNKIIKDLKDRGYWVMKTQGGVAGTPIGTPDIVACDTTGSFVAVEVKKINGKLSRQQILLLKKISKLSCDVYATNDKDFGKKINGIRVMNEDVKPSFTKTKTYHVYRGRFNEFIYD